MEVIGPDPIHAAETVPFDDSPQEHQVEAEPCDRIGEARGVRRSSWRRRTFALPGAFSPGLKPRRCQIKRSRGFENPLPRTESPGLAQLRRFVDPKTTKMSSAGQFATPNMQKPRMRHGCRALGAPTAGRRRRREHDNV